MGGVGEFSTACASKDKVSRINPAVCKSKNRRGEVRQKLMINSDRVSQAVGGGEEEEEEEEEEESLIHWLLLSRVIRDARLNGVH